MNARFFDDDLAATPLPEGGPGVSVLGIAAIAFLVEVLLFFWLMKGVFPPAFVFLLHVAVVAVLAFLARSALALNKPVQGITILAMVTACAGPFGAFGVVMVCAMCMAMAARSFDSWFASMFPEDHVSDGEKLAEYLDRYQQDAIPEYAIVPFREILQLGTVRQKQDMLGVLGRHFHPSFMPALKLALKDDNNSVRIQAATALANIENRFMKRLIFIQQWIEKRPNDPRVLFAAAQLHDEHAYAGLLDEAQARDARNKALGYYQSVLKTQPNDLAAIMAVGRLYVRNSQYQEAIDWFESAMARGHHSPAAVLWLMECYFRKQRYGSLGELARRNIAVVEALDSLPMVVKETVRSWAGMGSSSVKERAA